MSVDGDVRPVSLPALSTRFAGERKVRMREEEARSSLTMDTDGLSITGTGEHLHFDVSGDASSPTGSRSRPVVWRRWRVIASIAVLVVVAATSWWVGTQTTSVASEARRTAPPPPALLTAPVVDQVLTTEVPVAGDIEDGHTENVDVGTFSVPGAVPIVTAPGPAVGIIVTPGSVVVQVAGRPVIVLAGSTPMYRTIEPGDHGSDVAKLQLDLESLGYRDGDVSGTYGPATQSALAALYAHDGYSPPPVTPADAVGAPAGSTTAPTTSTPAPATSSTFAAPAGMSVPQAEIVFVPTLPATVSTTSEVVGQQLNGAALVLSWGDPIAILSPTAAQAAAISSGDAVSIALPGGRSVSGKVTCVQAPSGASSSTGTTGTGSTTPATSQAPGGQNGSAGAQGSGSASEVMVALAGDVPASTIGATVNAQVVLASTGGPVLAVPVAGIRADGADAAYVLVRVGRSTRRIDVRLGQSIGGMVQVTPEGGTLPPGDAVIIAPGTS